MGWSLPKTLGRLTWLALPFMCLDHLSVARCCAFIAEQNLAEAAALMGAGLNLLYRDLILESIWVELEKKRSSELVCFSFCSTRDVPIGKNLVEPRRLELLTPADCVGALPKFQAVQPWVVVVIKPLLNSLTFSLL